METTLFYPKKLETADAAVQTRLGWPRHNELYEVFEEFQPIYSYAIGEELERLFGIKYYDGRCGQYLVSDDNLNDENDMDIGYGKDEMLREILEELAKDITEEKGKEGR